MTLGLPDALVRHRALIEEALRQALGQRSSPLYQMMEYHLGWAQGDAASPQGSGGKRLRPALCLLACESLGGTAQQALPAAVAVELVHNFSLIHDDIQDGAPERHHRPTVWWVWGPAQAINAGDGMHCLARLALFELAERGVSSHKLLLALQLLDRTALELCEGQFLDIRFQEEMNISVNDYLGMAQLKTGALIGCAMQLGALLATDNASVIAAFGESGRKLGAAFQVRDDILDLWFSETDAQTMPPGDILSKKKTLPVVYALERASIRQKRELGTLYMKRVLEPVDVSRILVMLEEMDAREAAQGKADELCQEALAEIERVLPPGTDARELKEAAEFLVTRSQ